ncbi:hypothetical protein M2650_00090 [Luteimonas sp. SX5]|uniref:Uncharacterized protein n=1 Tax=Luteimonas galliterrae TaxID=2940486 RepID=A0ABT0MDW0_9GAMM|nr:hypothetical protein [Luteimonas galliterrae]MCL1633050.1 hypothetical protein [Luteimonas galliterrae]
MKRLLALTLLLASAAQAQDSQPVPPHEEFVDRQCLPAMLREVGDAPPQRIAARAACECSYRQLSGLETMTQAQFDAAATVCRYEFQQDGEGFMQKYASPDDSQ